MKFSIRKSIFVSFIGFLASSLLHFERGIDWKIQSLFRNNGAWLIDQNEPIEKIVFYQLPKFFLIAFGVTLTAYGLKKWHKDKKFPRRVFYPVLCLILIPLVVSLAKQFTNEPCPVELEAFGGSQKISAIFGQCFPGGHASGGFSLLSLYWCCRRKLKGVIPGLLAGSILGAYQIFKGAHFFSDTLCTAFLAWLICEMNWSLVKIRIRRKTKYEQAKAAIGPLLLLSAAEPNISTHDVLPPHGNLRGDEIRIFQQGATKESG